jgi:hypothetical protein
MTDQDTDPEATQALARLRPLLSLAYRAYEHSIEKARAYFQSESLTYSPYAFASIARCHFHEFVSAPQWASIGFKLFRRPNDGIDLLYRHCRIRVWKGGDEGQLPPLRSDGMAEYCYQPSLFPFGALGAPPRKLAVTWELNSDQSLKALFLICPKLGGKDGEVYWSIEIPHPATMVVPEHDFGTTGDLDDFVQPQVGSEEQ